MTSTTGYAADVSDQLGDVKPHVAAAANLIANLFGVTEMSGWRATATDATGHPAGLAIDIPASRGLGDRVAAWVSEHAGALGVKYLIWQQAIWKAAAPTWEPMATRSGDRPGYDPNHLRHVHISFTETPPPDGTAGGLGGVLSSLTSRAVNVVRGTADALNPLDDWAAQAMAIGIKIAAVGAGLALIVVGANRLVAPVISDVVEKVAA